MKLLPILMLLAGVAQAGEMAALCPEGKSLLELLNKPDGKVSARVVCPSSVAAYRSEGEWTKVQAGPKGGYIEGYVPTKLLTDNPPPAPIQENISFDAARTKPAAIRPSRECATAPKDPKVTFCGITDEQYFALGWALVMQDEAVIMRAVMAKAEAERVELEKIKAANPAPIVNVDVGVGITQQNNTTVVPIIVNGR